MSCFNFDEAIVAELSFLNNISKKYELSEEERQDLVSDTILKAYKYKDTTEFESRGKFKGWLGCIMESNFINQARRNQVHGWVHYDNEQMITLFESLNATECTDTELLNDEEYDVINEVFKDDVEKKIAIGYAQGYSYQHLAEIFDISLGTLKSRIFNIRKKIAKIKRRLL